MDATDDALQVFQLTHVAIGQLQEGLVFEDDVLALGPEPVAKGLAALLFRGISVSAMMIATETSRTTAKAT